MTRRHVVAAAVMAVLMIAGAVYTTFWLLAQPVPETVTSEPDALPGEGEPSALAVPDEAPPEVLSGTIQVRLYVPAGSGESLSVQNQEIQLESSTQKQAKQVVELLLRRSSAIPRGVQLREVFITSQGVAYVDLSRELVQNHPGGTSAEQLTVFSLSNTLIANFPSIQMVKILVEGREVQTLAGHLDLTNPFGRGPAYLRPESEQSGSRDGAS